MLNKAPVADSDVEAQLHERYGIDVRTLTFLPLGNDTNSMAYYRAAWAMDDLTDYVIRILGEIDYGAETRESSVAGFDDLFRPGNTVAVALNSPPPRSRVFANPTVVITNAARSDHRAGGR